MGEHYRLELETCLRNLLILNYETPELFALEFSVSTRGAFLYDFVDRMFEGMRRLGLFCRPADDIAEIRRLALNKRPDGGLIRQRPLSFDMASPKGYCGRNITPRLESSVEK